MKKPFYIRTDPVADLFVVGEDAAEFLQGQFTNDLRPGEPPTATYGLWLNQKGRVVADSFILREAGDGFRVVSERSPASTIRERLEGYIIADDVTIEDRTGQSAGWVLGGPGVTDWIEQLGFSISPSRRLAQAGDALLLPSRLGGRGSWRLLVPQAAAAGWEEKIAQVAGMDGRMEHATVEAHRIADGVPSIPDELGTGDLPNEGGLETEAISYTKGCYLGQEVMSRLKNLGRVRRRLHVVRGRAGATAAVAVGSELCAGDRRVGELRSWQPDSEGWVGLAMLHTDHVAPGHELRLGGGKENSMQIDRLAEGRAW